MAKKYKNYMVPRGYEHYKDTLKNKPYCITQLFDAYHCFLVKEYREVFITSLSGRKIKMFNEFIPILRFLKVPCLKLQCQLIPFDTQSVGEARKEEAFNIVHMRHRKEGLVKLIVMDVPTFENQSYTYRRAMMDYYLPDDNPILIKNPILSTGYGTDEIDYWYQWAINNNRDGILINLKEYPYVYRQYENFLVRRV